MSLLSSHSDANKVVKALPVVRYESTPYHHKYSDGTRKAIYWTITRTSSWDFSYIGMEKSAAEECAAAVRAEYFLPYLAWSADVDDTDKDDPIVTVNQYTEMRCSANIQARRSSGDAWDVNVTVEETDVVVSSKELKTLAEIEAYFQEATDRKIVTGRFKILDAHWSTAFNGIIECTIFQDIENFSPSNVTAKRLVSGQWLSLTVSGGNAKSITVQSQHNETIKLFYGEIETNQWTTSDSESPTIDLESVETDLGLSPPHLPGATYIEFHTFYAEASIENIIKHVGFLALKFGSYSMPCSDMTSLGGYRFRLTFYKNVNIDTDLMFEDGSFAISYNDGKSYGLSDAIAFSDVRGSFAKIGLVECIGWYVVSGELSKTWRLKVHVITDIDFTLYGSTHDVCTLRPDSVVTQYPATFSADPDSRYDYVTTVDVKEQNSVFNTGIFLHYKVGTTDKYSGSIAIPTDGGEITP